MEQKQDQQIQSIPFQNIDVNTVLGLTKTQDVNQRFFMDFCGIERIKKGENFFYQRISKPIITYEFAKELVAHIYRISNRINRLTDFSEERIETYMLNMASSLADFLGIKGVNHLISDKAWEIILKLSAQDKEGKSFWEKDYNLVWNYSDPVSSDMLTIIKKDYNLESESFAQDVTLKIIWQDILIALEGSINTSKKHLLLEYLKTVHKESVVSSTETDSQNSEGVVNKFKNGFRRMFQ